MHPALGGTKLWGYADVTSGSQNPVHGYLGPAIVSKKGRPVQITYINNLPPTHILPVDRTIMGTNMGEPDNRMVTHLHGGFTPWQYDGGPYSWFTPGAAKHGPDYRAGDYIYPNDQSARLAWYHDHSLGITRLNAYAGMVAPYLIMDDFEAELVSEGLLPDPVGVPLVIQDKSFNPDGSLWYPNRYEKNSQPAGTGRWDWGPDATPPAKVSLDPDSLSVSLIPEFFADTTLINGMAYPYLNVEPKRYRFRLLNGSQARFYNLQLYYEDAAHPGEANLRQPGPMIIQVGTEGGFLPKPVVLNNPPQQIAFDTNPTSPTFGNAIQYTLLLSPAERADVIIDFAGARGSSLILYSDAPAPFPGGDPRNDYYTGDPDQSATGGALTTKEGYGPNTRTLLKIRVADHTPPVQMPENELIGRLTGRLASQTPNSPQGKITKIRDLTLNEDFDDYGRLIQKLGTNVSIGHNNQGLTTFARAYDDPATEIARWGDVEVWRIFNLTGDTHPVHFHLVNVQVMGRQAFDTVHYNGTPTYLGRMREADANEQGWKETVRMNPGEMTAVIMTFNKPQYTDPGVKSVQFPGYYNYVWHCHILEHEEHDMMRPLLIQD
jgi:spore coat protein A